jgi:hypothetical protein
MSLRGTVPFTPRRPIQAGSGRGWLGAELLKKAGMDRTVVLRIACVARGEFPFRSIKAGDGTLLQVTELSDFQSAAGRGINSYLPILAGK